MGGVLASSVELPSRATPTRGRRPVTDPLASWRIRVSRSPRPDAPRETLTLAIKKSFTAVETFTRAGRRDVIVWRASARDARGRGHAGVGNTPEEAVQRVVRNLAGSFRGWMIWAVAPPGEALAEDGRPASSAREPVRRDDVRSLDAAQDGVAHPGMTAFGLGDSEAMPVPTDVVNLARRAILLGASAYATGISDLHDGQRRTYSIVTIRGVAAETMKAELRAAGFKRRGSATRWEWTPIPAPPRRPPPLDAPPEAPPPAPPRPVKLRVVR